MTNAEIKAMQDKMMADLKKDQKDYVTRLKEAAEKRKAKEVK